MNILPTTLAPLADIASKLEGTRWACTGIEFESLPDHQWRATATDCRRLIRVTGENQCDPRAYPETPALTAAPNSATKALIPASKWQTFFKMAAKMTKKRHLKQEVQTVALKISDESATFACTDMDSSPVESTKLVEGRFPPADDIMPKQLGKGLAIIDVNPDLLAETLAAMSKMQDKETDVAVRIEILEAKNAPIHLSTNGANGTKIEAILMPMGENAYNPIHRLKRVIGKLFRRRNAGIAVSRSQRPIAEKCHYLESKYAELMEKYERLEKENDRLRKKNHKLSCDASMKSILASQSRSDGFVKPQLTRAERLAAVKGSSA